MSSRDLAALATSVPGMASPATRIRTDHVPETASPAVRIRTDHAALKPLFRDALAASGDRTAEKAHAILVILGPHEAFEEQVAFAPLRGERWVGHVLAEHSDLEKALGLASRGDADALRYAADLGLGHLDEEEAFVLPLLEGRAL